MTIYADRGTARLIAVLLVALSAVSLPNCATGQIRTGNLPTADGASPTNGDVPSAITPPASRQSAWMLHIVDRFSPKVPSSTNIGEEIKVKILYPYAMVRSIYAREHDDGATKTVGDIPAHLEPTADGYANVVVPTLMTGSVQFNLIALFYDGAISSRHFLVKAGPPLVKPMEFHADWSAYSNRLQTIRMKIGTQRTLMPGATFASAPMTKVSFGRGVSFMVVGGNADPVISVDARGVLKALRPGHGVVEARLGPFPTTLAVDVPDPAESPCRIVPLPQLDKTGHSHISLSVCQY